MLTSWAQPEVAAWRPSESRYFLTVPLWIPKSPLDCSQRHALAPGFLNWLPPLLLEERRLAREDGFGLAGGGRAVSVSPLILFFRCPRVQWLESSRPAFAQAVGAGRWDRNGFGTPAALDRWERNESQGADHSGWFCRLTRVNTLGLAYPGARGQWRAERRVGNRYLTGRPRWPVKSGSLLFVKILSCPAWFPHLTRILSQLALPGLDGNRCPFVVVSNITVSLDGAFLECWPFVFEGSVETCGAFVVGRR